MEWMSSGKREDDSESSDLTDQEKRDHFTFIHFNGVSWAFIIGPCQSLCCMPGTEPLKRQPCEVLRRKKHTATTRLQLGLVLQRKKSGAMKLLKLNAYYAAKCFTRNFILPLTSILRGNKRLRKINSLAQRPQSQWAVEPQLRTGAFNSNTHHYLQTAGKSTRL